jgi:hypothetical protein
MTYSVKYMDQPFLQVTSKGPARGPARPLHFWRSHRVVMCNVQQLGKYILYYDYDQDPGNAPLKLVFQCNFSISQPTSSPFYYTGNSHVLIRRPELAYYHATTIRTSS